MKTAVGSLVHFSIPVTDLDRSIQFYCALFGWRFQTMTPAYSLVEGGIGSLSLEKGTVSGTMPILYFSVSNIEQSLQTANTLGAEIILNKSDSGNGKGFFATIRDLDGNVIGLWSQPERKGIPESESL
jgi:predicted enzyme related to lactoylglutathione lyase